MKSIKNKCKKILNAVGLNVHKFNALSTAAGLLNQSLKYFEIDLVFDIGANEGQYAEQIISGGYKGKIYSFEPLTSAHLTLVKNSQNFSNWIVYPRCALGESECSMTMNVSSNSVSSSLLPMRETHISAAPNSKYLAQEVTKVITLDSIFNSIATEARNPFLKIDTQGYEWQVLNGSSLVLDKVKGIQIELSLVSLYEGQRLWQDVLTRLEGLGFTLWGLQPAFTNHSNGRVMQIDGLFFRE